MVAEEDAMLSKLADMVAPLVARLLKGGDGYGPGRVADTHKFRTGERVRVYSLQSFFGGGFIDGNVGTVKQDQIGGSVLISLPGRENSYEVYPQQLRLL